MGGGLSQIQSLAGAGPSAHLGSAELSRELALFARRAFSATWGRASVVMVEVRQRDGLPLPLLYDDVSSHLLGGTSRGCRQRRSRREAITCRGNRAITSINELYSGPGACQASPGPRGEAQCIAQEGIRQAMVDLDAPPKDLHVQEAVRQLLREDTRYSDVAVGGSGTLATYGMGEVSLPSDVANCPEVVQVLPQGKADVFRGFRGQMLRSPEDFEEHQALVGEAGLYMDPVLA